MGKSLFEEAAELHLSVCQDFFKMIVQPGWQQELYHAIKNNSALAESYSVMRDFGIENYTVDDMDISLICYVALRTKKYKHVQTIKTKTEERLKEIKSVRNKESHHGKREINEKRFLETLLGLCRLEEFVKTVDNEENDIDNETRLLFRQTYIIKIEDLKQRLDEERIENFRKSKEMLYYIQMILNSDDPAEAWGRVSGLYLNKINADPQNTDLRYEQAEFWVLASDAGIRFAHYLATSACFSMFEEYEDGVRHAFLALDAEPDCAPKIVNVINYYLKDNKPFTDSMKKLFEKIVSMNYTIEETNNTIQKYRCYKNDICDK